jgi:arginase family enzyme
MVEGNLNRLRDLPGAGGGHSVTLGDFSALADHLIEFGPVRGLAKAEEDGLLGASHSLDLQRPPSGSSRGRGFDWRLRLCHR